MNSQSGIVDDKQHTIPEEVTEGWVSNFSALTIPSTSENLVIARYNRLVELNSLTIQ